jgi:hypothetical protein
MPRIWRSPSRISPHHCRVRRSAVAPALTLSRVSIRRTSIDVPPIKINIYRQRLKMLWHQLPRRVARNVLFFTHC